MTDATSGSAFNSPTARSIAPAAALPVTVAPRGATKTTRADAPSAPEPGRRWASRSNAFCDSVPGIENEFDIGAESVVAPRPITAMTSAHSSAINPRRRWANLPSLYRSVATQEPPGRRDVRQGVHVTVRLQPAT